MEKLLTIEQAASYGISLCPARRLTDDEKAHYKPEFQERMFIGAGNHIDLKYVTWRDMPNRPCDGEFPGCNNQAWEITKDEWDHYLEMEASRAAVAAEQARQEQIAELETQKVRAEAQVNFPSKEKVDRRTRKWNNVYNEGGEGYVPHIYTRDEYERICARLEELRR